MAITGLDMGKFRKDDDKDDDYNINVCLPRTGRQTIDALGKVLVNSATGVPIPLAQLADIRLQSSPTSIRH